MIKYLYYFILSDDSRPKKWNLINNQKLAFLVFFEVFEWNIQGDPSPLMIVITNTHLYGTDLWNIKKSVENVPQDFEIHGSFEVVVKRVISFQTKNFCCGWNFRDFNFQFQQNITRWKRSLQKT